MIEHGANTTNQSCYTRDTFYLLRKLVIKIKRKKNKWIKIASQVIKCTYYTRTRMNWMHANTHSYTVYAIIKLLCRHCRLILFAYFYHVLLYHHAYVWVFERTLTTYKAENMAFIKHWFTKSIKFINNRLLTA